MDGKVVKVGTYKVVDATGATFTVDVLQRVREDGDADSPRVESGPEWHRVAETGNRVKLDADGTLVEEKTGRKLRRIE